MPKMQVKKAKRKTRWPNVLVGGVRTIKIKPFSKRRAAALKRLAKSEHEPIKSKALFYSGRR